MSHMKENDSDKVRTIMIVVEPDADGGMELSNHLIDAARKVASLFKHRLIAYLPCTGHETIALELAKLGFERVFRFEQPLINAYPQEVALSGLIHLQEALDSDLILFSASEWGTEIAARTASKLGVGLWHDLVEMDMSPDGSGLVGDHKGFENGLICRTKIEGPCPRIATIKPGAFPLCRETGHKGCVVEDFTLGLDPVSFKIRMTRTLSLPPERTPDLEKAKVVVAGGEGVGGKEGFAMLGELAGLLDGSVGCTLPPVEHGWMSRESMIGSTGKTVHPKMYIGCGISGDVYHTSGMADSEYIVVINNDEKASFLDLADCGIIGDLHEIVPFIIKRLRGN